MFIRIQSDHFYQIKPNRLSEYKKSIDGLKRHLPYQFPSHIRRTSDFQTNSERAIDCLCLRAIDCLRFSQGEIYDLLQKAVSIVENTEEYTNYLLEDTFVDSENKSHKYSIPPGTVRFYSQDLICFFNGKTWKKLKQ